MISSKKQPSSSLDRIVALSRTVKTIEGEKKFKEAVGSLIQPKSIATPDKVMTAAVVANNKASKPATTAQPASVSLPRLKSLQTALRAAKATGNKAVTQQAETDFVEALRVYSEGKPAATVLAELGSK